MRPDAGSPSPSPFSAIPEAEWLCANALAFAIFDSFPVSPGHALVITRRVVPTYFDCTAAEQAAVMELVGEVKRLLDARLEPKPDGYNVGFNAGAAAGQTVPHVHVHVIPRRKIGTGATFRRPQARGPSTLEGGKPFHKTRSRPYFLPVAHEFLRRDISDAATGQPVEMSPRKWESSWRKFPISIWMQEQEGRSWFAIDGDSLRVAFECDPFHTKVIESRGKPFLKLPTVDEEPGRPDGPVLVRRPVHRQEVPLGEDRHRRRLAARPHSAAAVESGVRADHARAGGRRRPHDRREVRSCRTVTGLRFTTKAGRRVVCRA
jgi:diadenosine tetraphosphate (Ap4A) HIT family hydrolase